jgi:hypothetical protein
MLKLKCPKFKSVIPFFSIYYNEKSSILSKYQQYPKQHAGQPHE